MAATRRYVVHGRMPQTRTPHSGLYSLPFKEDGFYLEYSERTLHFADAAKSQKEVDLPLYFISKVYYQSRRMIESIGLADDRDRVEMYIQYARLPVLDQLALKRAYDEIDQRVAQTKADLPHLNDANVQYDLFRFDFCDEPFLYMDFDTASKTLKLKVRAPQPPAPPLSTNTKKGRLAFFKDYEDVLCSQAVRYAMSAFEAISSLQTVELTLTRIEAKPVQGLALVDTSAVPPKTTFRKFGRAEAVTPAVDVTQRRKDMIRSVKQEQKALKQKQKQYAMKTTHFSDELFDNTLPHESALLAARIPRADFMALQRSKASYSAFTALSQFDLRLQADEDSTAFGQVEPYFEAAREFMES